MKSQTLKLWIFVKAPDGWKPEHKQLWESINKALKIFLESLPWQTQVQGQFWLFSLCVLLSECCMFVKIGTYQSLCICGGSGWLWCQHTRKNRDFLFWISLYLNLLSSWMCLWKFFWFLITDFTILSTVWDIVEICEFNTDFPLCFKGNMQEARDLLKVSICTL